MKARSGARPHDEPANLRPRHHSLRTLQRLNAGALQIPTELRTARSFASCILVLRSVQWECGKEGGQKSIVKIASDATATLMGDEMHFVFVSYVCVRLSVRRSIAIP
ncbi:hypothetical protein KM043_003217 [Ampulex compressa]|nr:hypothetical protein KM043_003217 [Ampulex compressa]